MLTDDEVLALLAELAKRSEGKRYCPHTPTPKQQEFLDCDAEEVCFGGAASGGKSDALLMAALMYVDQPGYSALILRRTYADLSLPGAIMDRAYGWLQDSDAHWSGKDKKWTFPSGATLQFGYLDSESDKYRYASAEFQFIGFDELTQFQESQYRFLWSRLRKKTGVDVPLRMMSATNPGGVGHHWVKKRFIDHNDDEERVFIPAGIRDNPHVDKSYIKNLERLPEIQMRQLLHGDWITDEQGLVYRFDSAKNLMPPEPLRDGSLCILGVDLGTREDKPTTAFSLIAFHPHQEELRVLKCVKEAAHIPSTVAHRIRAFMRRYPIERIVMDAGGLGKGYIEECRQRYRLPVQAAQKPNKLGFRKLMNGDFEKGLIKLYDKGTDALIDEYEKLRWNDKGDDNEKGADNHCSDATLYAWREARHWLFEPEKHKPKPGTKEWAKEEEDRIFSNAVANSDQEDVPWYLAN